MIVTNVSVSGNQPPWHGLVFTDAEREQFMRTNGTFFRRKGVNWQEYDVARHPVPNSATLDWLWSNVGDDRYTYWSIDRVQRHPELVELKDHVSTWESSFQLIPPERRNWTCLARGDTIAFQDIKHAMLFKLTFA